MYCKNYTQYNKRKSSEVKIGNIPLGKNNQIKIQSMTTTLTSNIKATVEQSISIFKAGADYVRITTPAVKDAEILSEIKKEINSRNFNFPLIADVHFSPKTAEVAARIIEKVRINPGNYVAKKLNTISYTEDEYQKEVKIIEEKFIPLINICKKNNTAIRIGTNHGSLSDRILNKYGDTPEGMTEATMEFLRICKKENFEDVVISMKSGNPIVMVKAVRLLVEKMDIENMYLPLHLGVTEAGSEDEGRIKSALGIGSLLADGIGDTIRVSLTEDPEKEIPVARKLVEIFDIKRIGLFKSAKTHSLSDFNPYEYNRRKTFAVNNIGENNLPVVISDISNNVSINSIIKSGFKYNGQGEYYYKTDFSADYLFVGNKETNVPIPEYSKMIFTGNNKFPDKLYYSKLIESVDFQNTKINSEKQNFISFEADNFENFDFTLSGNLKNTVFVLNLTNSKSAIHAGRVFFLNLIEKEIKNPVILHYEFSNISENALLQASAEIGALLIDGFGDGIWIKTNSEDIDEANELSFGILQASRTRITKTEYISCPSCGRTLFDLQKTTAKIKSETQHLKGLKIGIMGCIVNGPGEMTDADYGYVGSSKGKITLYKNKEVFKKNIPEKKAVKELIKLIKENGDWIESEKLN